jgi:TrmH family RNA methyltransferase
MQIQPTAKTIILDRLQDPGNVGSILRSAAAFGYQQVIALKGSVALYAPKVLRAGMGAHFGLRLIEGASLDDMASLQHPLAVTSSHQGQFLHQLLLNNELPAHINWALGHEGQGVCGELQALANLHVRIAQPGGEESLNVAAAAAICLHASGSVQMDTAISRVVSGV